MKLVERTEMEEKENENPFMLMLETSVKDNVKSNETNANSLKTVEK